MSEPPEPPNPPARLPLAGEKPRGFPWSLIVVPLLFLVVAYVTSRNWGANLDEATLRRKAEEYLVSVLSGNEPARVTIDKVEKHGTSANLSGTAVQTDFSGNTVRHDWRMTYRIKGGEYKATDWKVTPQKP